MRKHENVAWCTRLDFNRPYQMVGIEGDQIEISFFPGNKGDGASVVIDRSDARLLAKRINSCLDATVKK